MNSPSSSASNPDFPPFLIRASAGAGKTHELSNRFLCLLAAGESPSGILATTFTRKAAGEILGRVLMRLADASADPRRRDRLADELHDATLTSERIGELVRAVVRDLARLRISTLDAFFADLGGAFGPDLGLPVGWEIADPEDIAGLRIEAIDLALREQNLTDLVELMRDLGQGRLKQVVAADFDEAIKDLHAIVADAPPKAWEGTLKRARTLDAATLAASIEALAAYDFSNKHFKNARDTAVDAARQQDWKTVLGSKMLDAAAYRSKFQRQFVNPEICGAAAQLHGHAHGVLLQRLLARTTAARRLVVSFDRHFRTLQSQRKMLRFEDVTRAIAAGPLADRMEEVFYRLDGGIWHLLLDEFQDTSISQWQAIRPFANVVSQVGEKSRSLLVVGDVKQAIYGWRGGVAEIFDAVASELPGVIPRSLATSYRSAPAVIDAVNKIFSTISTNPALKGHETAAESWSKAFEPHTTVHTGMRGHVRLAEAPADDEEGAEADGVLDFAAAEIARIVSEAPGHGVGVLVRKNETVAALVDLLRKRNVPASAEGGRALTDSPAVRAVLSLMTLADHPGHTIARFHVARSPLGQVLGFTVHDDHGAARRLSFDLRRALLAEGYGAVIFGWTEKLAPFCDAKDLKRLLQLVEIGYAYAERATLRPGDFVTHVEGQRVLEMATTAVRVMTYHQAKGLEFDVVVLPDLEEKILAHPPKILTERASPLAPITRVSFAANADLRKGTELESMYDAHCHGVVREALSLLYVAVTRAVHALLMIVAPSATAGGESNLPLTFAGVLRGALASEGGPAGTLFEHGDPAWCNRAEHSPPQPAHAAPAPMVQAIKLAMKKSARPARKDRLAPSSLEGGAQRTLADTLSAANQGALRYGTVIHRFFELITWLEDGQPTRAQLQSIASAEGFHANDALASITDFERMLHEPATRSAMSRSGYPVAAGELLRVRREMPFVVHDGDHELGGSIDRLVLWQQDGRTTRAEVLDYKTDNVDASDAAALAERVAFYRPQLDAYRRAVATLEALPLDRVGARLLFVGAGATVRL